MEQKVSNSVLLASQMKGQETKIRLLEEENDRLLQVSFFFFFLFIFSFFPSGSRTKKPFLGLL